MMRVVGSLLGLALLLSGIVWILQGLNLDFRVGFVVGDCHWTIYGVIAAGRRRDRAQPSSVHS